MVFTTADGGDHWDRRQTPPAMPKEGAFAASGTCLITMGTREAWFGTGGVEGARVFHSADRGLTWTVATTPIRNDAAAAGHLLVGLLRPAPRHRRGWRLQQDRKTPPTTSR